MTLVAFQRIDAVILYSGDNAANQSAPDSARSDIFSAVARVVDSNGNGSYGSAVHLRGKYLLTAGHVSNRSHITFDGSTLWARDTSFAPVTFGSADMKLIKLKKDPGLAGTILLESSTGDIPRRVSGGPPRTEYTTATIIGWGRGRSSSDPDGLPTWNWGDSTTMAKRWGTNRIERSLSLSYTLNNLDYSYTALQTNLSSSAGNNEAATAIYDSGSGLFIEHEGSWKLAGLTTAVSTSESSTFSDTSGDSNSFVRINQYAADIEAAIPDVSSLPSWKVDHSLYGADAENDADTDFDGIGQLLEFALGGDPNVNDISIMPSQTIVEDGGIAYLELTLTRPIGLQGIAYIPQTTSDLTNWPLDSNGIVNSSPIPLDNGDSTETLVYRRSQPISDANRAFIRVNIAETP